VLQAPRTPSRIKPRQPAQTPAEQVEQAVQAIAQPSAAAQSAADIWRARQIETTQAKTAARTLNIPTVLAEAGYQPGRFVSLGTTYTAPPVGQAGGLYERAVARRLQQAQASPGATALSGLTSLLAGPGGPLGRGLAYEGPLAGPGGPLGRGLAYEGPLAGRGFLEATCLRELLERLHVPMVGRGGVPYLTEEPVPEGTGITGYPGAPRPPPAVVGAILDFSKALSMEPRDAGDMLGQDYPAVPGEFVEMYYGGDADLMRSYGYWYDASTDQWIYGMQGGPSFGGPSTTYSAPKVSYTRYAGGGSARGSARGSAYIQPRQLVNWRIGIG